MVTTTRWRHFGSYAQSHARMGSYQVLRHGMVWCAMHVINSVSMLCYRQSCLLPSSSIPVAYKYRDAHCISMVCKVGMVPNWPISMICQASRCSWYRPAPRQRPQTRERCLFVAELQRLWGQTMSNQLLVNEEIQGRIGIKGHRLSKKTSNDEALSHK